MEIEKLIRPHLKGLQAYSSARDEFTGQASIFLDANENSFGSAAAGAYHRYPDPHHQQLRSKWSVLRGIPVDQIFFGNGSDEPIDLLIRLFCEPGKDNIVTMPPTYGMYGVSAAINNVEVVNAPLTADFQIDLTSVKNAWNEHSKLLFVCSPNNPSGNILAKGAIETLLNEFPGIVIVDEAYTDFAEEESWSKRLINFDNLVVLQTLSKAWGMAAIRVGVAMTSPFITAMLEKIKPPYNISLPNQALALNALNNAKEQEEVVSKLNQQRVFLAKGLLDLEIVLNVFPSDANFLLVKFQEARQLYNYLTNHGVIVRDRSTQLHCEGCLRLTVGTNEENLQLIELITKYQA
jgi:histidinol-phosphate aminotransferase